MDAYVYQAALICSACVDRLKATLPIPDGADLDNESSFDSDDYPKGPYGHGGGEADCPQHCDCCGSFLENPLTDDGREYVREAFREFGETGHGDWTVLRQWADFYGQPDDVEE